MKKQIFIFYFNFFSTVLLSVDLIAIEGKFVLLIGILFHRLLYLILYNFAALYIILSTS